MKLQGNGVELEVGVQGEGPAVLLLHGFPDSSHLWRKQVPVLVEAGFKVVAPDQRGFGASDKPEGVDNYNILNILEDTRSILDALGIDKAHVVGHDWGAAVAWTFASLYQDRVASLVALSVGHPTAFGAASYEQLQRSWYMFMFQFEGVAEEWLSRNDFEFLRSWIGGGGDIERYVEDLSRPGALTAGLNWYRANLPPQTWISEPLELPAISAPTMGIWSTGDDALTEDQMTDSQKYVQGPWRYERVEASHWIPLEAADRLNELLLDFYPS
ncbi:MAG TPA: alpha/beta fold hydrolase [Actinomycetota bacterium]|nr:alpha/beta fold hydrolase [Actinomycetota bacterium]